VPALLLRRTRGAHYALPIVLSMCYLSVNTALFVISESLVAVAVFWIAFSLVLRLEDRPSLAAAVALAGVSFIGLRVYESFTVLGVLLALGSLRLLRRGVLPPARPLRLAVLAALLLQLGSSVIAVGSLFHPRSQKNMSWIMGSVTDEALLLNPGFLAGVAVLLAAAILFGILYLSRRGPRAGRLASIFSIVLTVLCLLPVNPPFLNLCFDPPEHFRLRLLNLLVPAATGAVLLLLRATATRRREALARTPLLALLLAFTGAFFLWNAVFQLHACVEWRGYRDDVVRVLREQRGVVDAGRTTVASSKYAWSWTMASTSIILTGMDIGPPVRTIIVSDLARKWSMTNPADPSTLPDLRAYGMTYGDELRR
jgi:hypothetical protein